MLTQNLLNQERKVKLRWFVTLSSLPLLGVVTAFGLVPHSDLGLVSDKVTVEKITLPELKPTTSPGTTYSTSFWRNELVRRGDTVDEILRRLNVEDNAASEYLRTSADAESFRKLDVGMEIQAETSADGGLVSLRYLSEDGAQTVIKKHENGFITQNLPAQLEKRLFVRTGEIQTNLYAATDAADMPEAAANQLVEIFSGDIDFHHDLRRGDKFTVVYEMTYSNGTLVSTGRIKAAEFINRGQSYRAIYFQTDDKHGDYYTPDGKNVRKAFLRSPIAFTRISSRFVSSRLHPVLNKVRAHKGVDFAAPIGTKVKATSDGVITRIGYERRGYGKFIVINHHGPYSSVYGHLSRYAKGLRRGQKVSQGDVIGYVGMTGLATGPHLHYELKVNGQQRDPLRVALPDAKPIDAAHKTAFRSEANSFVARLNMLRNTNLAMQD